MSDEGSVVSELEKKLKTCDPDIQTYIAKLTSENLKLHKEIVSCKAQQSSLNNAINALEAELDKQDPTRVQNREAMDGAAKEAMRGLTGEQPKP